MSSSQAHDERDSQTMTLSDGRTLGYAQFGHPQGYPLIYFHGYPSSRLEGSAIDSIALRRRIKLLTLDRPGFGLSTFVPDRKIMDWPSDVREFAQHAGLKKFAVMGGSGGGPYALACAKSLPSDMMTAVGLLAPAGPWDKAGHQDVMWSAWFTYLAAWYSPTLFKIAADGAIGSARWLAETKRVQGWIDALLEAEHKKQQEEAWDLGDEESKSRTVEEKRKRAVRMLLEAFAQGSQASVQEARLLTGDWGFKFEDITYDKIQIWHGTKDINAPIGQIRYMAEHLPHVALKEYEGEDHFEVVKHIKEIIGEFVTEEMVNEWFKQ
jgi:pimeloyl-ACP methyl ester carboxylesterase